MEVAWHRPLLSISLFASLSLSLNLSLYIYPSLFPSLSLSLPPFLSLLSQELLKIVNVVYVFWVYWVLSAQIDPENKDNLDNFNISRVLSAFFLMLSFYCGLGDIFPKCERNSGETLKKKLKTGEMLKLSNLSRFSGSIGHFWPNRRGKP